MVVQMPTMREVDMWVGEGLPVLLVPPSLEDWDVHAFALPRRRLHPGRASARGELAITLAEESHGGRWC